MTNKKRKSKAGGGGGTGGAAVAGGGGGGGGGGASGVGSSNSHKRPRFYDHSKNDTSGNSRDGGGGSTNRQSSRFTNDVDKQRGYYDATHGQFGAFPGLDDNNDGEFYGPANDGVDYLKMVRSEAKSVPALLIAGQQYQIVNSQPFLPLSVSHRPVDPPPDTLDYDDNGTDSLNYDDELTTVGEPSTTINTPLAPQETENKLPETAPSEDEYEISTPLNPSAPDPAGWYYDGTYTAAPPPLPPTPPTTALSLWHTSLLTSFRAFRHTFHTAPTIPFNANNLPPISSNLKFWVRQRRWQSYILHMAPTPRVLRAMSQLDVIRALEALTGAPGVKKGVQGWWAEWVWGLLVRCEVCLTADEVSVVRELAKKALGVRGRILDEGGHWREEPHDGGRRTIEDEDEGEVEDPVGWVEPGEEEKEEGEVEDEESDKAKFGDTMVKDATERPPGTGGGGQVRTEPNLETKFGEAPVTNPDAIDLDLIDEPEVSASSNTTTSGKSLELNPCGSPIPVPAPVSTPASVLHGPKRGERTLADTLGALDMVISIVGDFFGQRDLLDERGVQAGLVMV